MKRIRAAFYLIHCAIQFASDAVSEFMRLIA